MERYLIDRIIKKIIIISIKSIFLMIIYIQILSKIDIYYKKLLKRLNILWKKQLKK